MLGATLQRTKLAGIAEKNCAGSALMEESSRSPRRKQRRKRFNATLPEKKLLGHVKGHGGAALMGALSNQRKQSVAKEVVKLIARRKKPAGIVERSFAGCVLTEE